MSPLEPTPAEKERGKLPADPELRRIMREVYALKP